MKQFNFMRAAGSKRQRALAPSSFLAIFLILVAAVYAGCTGKDKKADPNEKPVITLQDLATRVSALEASQTIFQSSIDSINNDPALITTDDEAYGITRNKFGAFIVSCRGAAPYLDGYKIKLWIGNLTSITYKGFKIHIGYGPGIYPGSLTKDIDSTESLFPGRYSSISVVLAPAKPSDVKTLEVSIDLNEVSLYQPQ